MDEPDNEIRTHDEDIASSVADQLCEPIENTDQLVMELRRKVMTLEKELEANANQTHVRLCMLLYSIFTDI